jgi:hypothetical protein
MTRETAGNEALESVWRRAAPLLGLVLAEAALRAVQMGQLQVIQVDGYRLIVTEEEAREWAMQEI